MLSLLELPSLFIVLLRQLPTTHPHVHICHGNLWHCIAFVTVSIRLIAFYYSSHRNDCTNSV